MKLTRNYRLGFYREIGVIFINLSEENFTIRDGDRIAQLTFQTKIKTSLIYDSINIKRRHKKCKKRKRFRILWEMNTYKQNLNINVLRGERGESEGSRHVRWRLN
jgi:hypothetical protein